MASKYNKSLIRNAQAESLSRPYCAVRNVHYSLICTKRLYFPSFSKSNLEITFRYGSWCEKAPITLPNLIYCCRDCLVDNLATYMALII